MDRNAIQKFLGNKKWWIKEGTEAFFLHVIHEDKEYVSRPMLKLHARMFKDCDDACDTIKETIVKTVISSIEVQIMKDDNERKMQVIRDLKEGRRKSFAPPYWKKSK